MPGRASPTHSKRAPLEPPQSAATLSGVLAAFVARLEETSLPEDIIADARWRLSDCIGIALVGSRQEFAMPVLAVLEELGGRPDATVIGTDLRTSAPLAAMANGAFAHGADYDDTHGFAVTHITSVVVPTALAVAETVGASGAELMTAVVAGAEVGIRIAWPVGHRLLTRGFHVTGVVGPFAAAATASRLLGLDTSRIAHALGLAGSRAAGLRQGSHDGSWVKRLHSGWAAQAGIEAALLAAQGFTGPREVLEGKHGFYAALLHGEAVDTNAVSGGLGEHWYYPEATYKLFPNGSWNHSATAAVAEIVRRERLKPEDIARIDCVLPPVGISAVCEPREVRLHPQSPYHMKFSLPYSIAMLLVLGRIEPDDFTIDVLEDERIGRIARLVHCRPDASLNATTFPARVTVTTRTGEEIGRNVKAQKGSLDNPFTEAEHRDRFLRFAASALDEEAREQLLGALAGAWTSSDVREITRLSAADTQRSGHVQPKGRRRK